MTSEYCDPSRRAGSGRTARKGPVVFAVVHICTEPYGPYTWLPILILQLAQDTAMEIMGTLLIAGGIALLVASHKPSLAKYDMQLILAGILILLVGIKTAEATALVAFAQNLDRETHLQQIQLNEDR